MPLPLTTKVHTMRFYNLDGVELDVQDPKFFMDENELLENKLAIDEMIELYYE